MGGEEKHRDSITLNNRRSVRVEYPYVCRSSITEEKQEAMVTYRYTYLFSAKSMFASGGNRDSMKTINVKEYQGIQKLLIEPG